MRRRSVELSSLKQELFAETAREREILTFTMLGNVFSAAFLNGIGLCRAYERAEHDGVGECALRTPPSLAAVPLTM